MKSWNEGVSLINICKEVSNDLLRLYEEYYRPMSGYHHWGTKSFGIRYKIENTSIVECNTDEVKQQRVFALFMSLSCLFSTVKTSAKNFNLDDNYLEKIANFESELKTMQNTQFSEIKINEN